MVSVSVSVSPGWIGSRLVSLTANRMLTQASDTTFILLFILVCNCLWWVASNVEHFNMIGAELLQEARLRAQI